MTLDELLPTIRVLPRTEKFRLIQIMAEELQKQEKELEAAIIVGGTHLDAEAAAKMTDILEERKQKVI